MYTDFNAEFAEKITFERLIWNVNLSHRWVLKCALYLREGIQPQIKDLPFSVLLFFSFFYNIFNFFKLKKIMFDRES